jgi:hypothetical protein
MKHRAEGGAAFPSPGVVLQDGHQQGAYEGMTLRDYFAARAIQGMLAHRDNDFSPFRDESPDIFAADAYLIADAMLTARQK